MAKKVSAKARAAARKQRDKWKMKRWYTIRAPRHPWDFKNIGETLGESDESIVGRVYEMTLQEFNGDFTKMHVILRFRVDECVGRSPSTTPGCLDPAPARQTVAANVPPAPLHRPPPAGHLRASR